MNKKILLSLVVVFTMLGSVSAQQAFEKSDAALNIGIGLGSPNTTGIGLPAIDMSFEKGIVEFPNVGVITVGGEFGFKYNWEITTLLGNDFSDKYSNFLLGVRAAFHLGFLRTEKFDVYGGILTGTILSIWSSEFNDKNNIDYDSFSSAFTHDIFIGGRIMTSNNFGFFVELGYGGLSYMQGGITLKF